MTKKSVGGKSVSQVKGENVLTWQNLELPKESGFSVDGFYILNEDTKEIGVSINGGSYMKLKAGEMYSLVGLTKVESCVIDVDAKIRWGGLI